MLMIKRDLRADQSGFAALIIAFTLVTILSLLTIGFAQLIRNESKQALNRQLSSQAYYAAEGGISDAIQAINNGYSGNKLTCGPDLSAKKGAQYLSNTNVDKTPSGTKSLTSTEWSCLLINTAPSSIDYSSIDTMNPTIFSASAVDALDGSTPVVVNSITLAWQDADATKVSFRPGSGVSNTAFPTAGAWAAPGILRLSFTPLTPDGSGNVTRANLIRNTYSAFLYPNNSVVANNPGTANYTNDQTQTGNIIDGNCNIANSINYSRYCVATITIPGGFPAGPKLFFNLRSIYSKTNVHITINGGAARLLGAQSMIDSTGKSQGVLKRIQVRVPTNDKYTYPGFSLESVEGICKAISTYPNFANGCGY